MTSIEVEKRFLFIVSTIIRPLRGHFKSPIVLKENPNAFSNASKIYICFNTWAYFDPLFKVFAEKIEQDYSHYQTNDNQLVQLPP
jgi:hypothetical protein